MIIKVAKEDFILALPADPCHCPIANAIHRHTNRAVHVGDFSVTISGLGHYFMPPVARRFIQAFDNGGSNGRGFTFKLSKMRRKRRKS